MAFPKTLGQIGFFRPFVEESERLLGERERTPVNTERQLVAGESRRGFARNVVGKLHLDGEAKPIPSPIKDEVLSSISARAGMRWSRGEKRS